MRKKRKARGRAASEAADALAAQAGDGLEIVEAGEGEDAPEGDSAEAEAEGDADQAELAPEPQHADADDSADDSAELAAEAEGPSDAEIEAELASLADAAGEADPEAEADLAAVPAGHPDPATLDPAQLKALIEALLFASDKPLLTIADLSKVWVLADVYEQDLPFVEKGQPVGIHVLAFPERTFDGTFSYVAQVLDESTRSATARIELDNPGGMLKPGMMARVEARGLSRGNVMVPSSALLARRDQFFVFVKKPDGAFEEREITLAEHHGQHVTLLTGLRLGDEVVVEGTILLDAEANEAL